MSDHDRFRMLVAKRIGEPLGADDATALDAHLGACSSCTAIAAGMRLDDALLHAVLEPVGVAPRIRQAVLAEAAQSRMRPAAGRFVLILAAAIGAALLVTSSWVGGPTDEIPSSTPAGSRYVLPSPATGPASLPPIPSGTGPFVVAAYTYADQGEWRDTIIFRFDTGSEWSRTGTLDGRPVAFGGRNLRCVDIAGPDAWLVGVDETSGEEGGTAILFYLHDGAAGGAPDDQVAGFVAGSGQTPDALAQWCYRNVVPAGPFDLTSGDVVIDYNGVEGS